MAKNVRKLQIIAKFQKLLNMVTKLKKFTQMSNNLKKCQTRAKKRPKNGQIKKIYIYNHFSGSKLPQKIDTVG